MLHSVTCVEPMSLPSMKFLYIMIYGDIAQTRFLSSKVMLVKSKVNQDHTMMYTYISQPVFSTKVYISKTYSF